MSGISRVQSPAAGSITSTSSEATAPANATSDKRTSTKDVWEGLRDGGLADRARNNAVQSTKGNTREMDRMAKQALSQITADPRQFAQSMNPAKVNSGEGSSNKVNSLQIQGSGSFHGAKLLLNESTGSEKANQLLIDSAVRKLEADIPKMAEQLTRGRSFSVQEHLKNSSARKSRFQGYSPLGIAYSTRPKVADSTPIFPKNAAPTRDLDRDKVLAKLTQFDGSRHTKFDKERCGATALIASAINNGGSAALRTLIQGLSPALLPADAARLQNIDKRIANRSATFGDLGVLSDVIYKNFRTQDKQSKFATYDADMFDMYKRAGLKPPSSVNQTVDKVFAPGQSWPVNLGKNHWIVVGCNQQGKHFVYDPMPLPGRSQIQYWKSAGFQAYFNEIQRTQSGYAPITQQQAESSAAKQR